MSRADRDPAMREAFVRVCKDSKFTLDAIRAAQLVGLMFDVSPIEVWLVMPSLDAMNEIAAGKHPACHT